MKKGFTLIELVGVVLIIFLLALVAFPPILDLLKSTESKLSEATEKLIYTYADMYVNDNINDFPKASGNVYCITLRDIAEKDYIKSDLLDSKGNAVNLDTKIEIRVSDGYSYSINNSCVAKVSTTYADSSGANKPELANGLTPIKYNGTNWVVANVYEKWYDYDNKEWANAVVLNTTKAVGQEVSESDIDLWYVWIPRYKYKLFNANNDSANEQLIDITFESETASTGTVTCTTSTSGNGTSSETCTNASNGNWYTHPAFTFGNEELTGIWVGKFEVSGKTSKITVKPNVSSLRSITVSKFFTAIQNIKTTYSLTNYDSHMMKNMEWGAVAYLSHSKYGKGNTEIYINNSSGYYTGRSGGNIGGTTKQVQIQYPSSGSTSTNIFNTYGYYTYDGKVVNYDGTIGSYASDRTLGTYASTTGNIYGIYDMSGGALEYVMGNMVNSSNEFYSSTAGFTTIPDSKYYDSYTYSTSNTTHGRGKLGDATKETLKTFGSTGGGWHYDNASLPNSSYSWFRRGNGCNDGGSAGVFSFFSNGSASSSYSSRAVLVRPRAS